MLDILNLESLEPRARACDAVVQAVAGRGEVLIDGGVRRGTEVLKALALVIPSEATDLQYPGVPADPSVALLPRDDRTSGSASSCSLLAGSFVLEPRPASSARGTA